MGIERNEKVMESIGKDIWLKDNRKVLSYFRDFLKKIGEVFKKRNIEKKALSIFNEATESFFKKRLYNLAMEWIRESFLHMSLKLVWEAEGKIEWYDMSKIKKMIETPEWYSLCKDGILKLLEEGEPESEIRLKLVRYFSAYFRKGWGFNFKEFLENSERYEEI